MHPTFYQQRHMASMAKASPSPMKWTKRPPTAPGHWWCKARGQLSGATLKVVVHVYSSNPRAPTALDRVFWDGENFNIKDDCFLEWSDQPIPEPLEA